MRAVKAKALRREALKRCVPDIPRRYLKIKTTGMIVLDPRCWRGAYQRMKRGNFR